MGDFSTFLFARPSFSEGMGRILDFGNTLTEYNRSESEQQADMIACWMEWEAIANDFRQQLETEANVIEQSREEKTSPK